MLPAARARSAGPGAGASLLPLPSLCGMVLQMCAGVGDEYWLSLGLGIRTQFLTLECQTLCLPTYLSCMRLSFVEGSLYRVRRPFSFHEEIAVWFPSLFHRDSGKMHANLASSLRSDSGLLTIPEIESGALRQEMT